MSLDLNRVLNWHAAGSHDAYREGIGAVYRLGSPYIRYDCSVYLQMTQLVRKLSVFMFLPLVNEAIISH
jgi:hypothetical protein